MKSLDILRGLMACSIMIYHYIGWVYGPVDSSSLIGRLGLYGVSIFYILSGLTLFVIYHASLKNSKMLAGFFIKRAFRIIPLLCMATLFTLFIRKEVPDPYTLLINVTGLFGFIDPANYIATGAWSIGNELVFYSLFPLYIFLFNAKYIKVFTLAVTASVAAGLFFSFSLDSNDWWPAYVNPLNQLFFFTAGISIGALAGKISLKKELIAPILVAALILFSLYPVENNDKSLVTGFNRILFSSISILTVAVVFNTEFHKEGILVRAGSYLGEISYSVYLLHPIVYNVIHAIGVKVIIIPDWVVMPLSVFVTIVSSGIVYKFIEKPIMAAGKRLAGNKNYSKVKAPQPEKVTLP